MKLVFYSLLTIFLSCLIYLLGINAIAFAQETASACAVVKIGNAPGQPTLPAQCAGVGGASKWPFPTKDPSQYKRIDQGWDLEFNQPTDVLAVAEGDVVANPGKTPCNGGEGFGTDYPVETLTNDIVIQGRSYHQIYYGHIHTTKTGHVKAGDVIGHTFQCVMLQGVWVNWLEVGFWENGPKGQGAFPTVEGTDMEEYLNGTRTAFK